MAYPPNTGYFDQLHSPYAEQIPNSIYPIQPLERALNFPNAPIETNPRFIPQPPYQHSQSAMDFMDAMRGEPKPIGPRPQRPIPPMDSPIGNPPRPPFPNPPIMQGLPGLQAQFNNPGNMAMPAGSMQSPFPGGNQPMARPSGRPKLPDPPQPPRQQQGTPPQRGPFGQTFGERQY